MIIYYALLIHKNYSFPNVGCEFGRNDFGIYADSRKEYWSDIRRGSRNFDVTDFIDFVDIWNEKQQTWNRIFHNEDGDSQVSKLFR